jgi:HTH-type transcriptional regulator, sugar sensing transcriptional regulator
MFIYQHPRYYFVYEELTVLGLTRTESKIYSMLIELGRAQAGLISRKTGIHRRSVYDALERLIEKGLVSYIRENEKRVYIPTDPARLKEIAEEMTKGISQILPTLEQNYHSIKEKQETSFFRGKEGIRSIFEDQLKVGETIYIISTAYSATEGLKYYMGRYTEKSIKKKIKLQILYAKGDPTTTIPLADIRHLPDEFASPVATNIYGNRVAVLIWSLEPLAILIKNKQVAETYKKYFDVLWKFARK